MKLYVLLVGGKVAGVYSTEIKAQAAKLKFHELNKDTGPYGIRVFNLDSPAKPKA